MVCSVVLRLVKSQNRGGLTRTKDTRMGYSIGQKGKVSNSLLYKSFSARPWLLVTHEPCAEGYVWAQENLIATR